MKKYILFLLIFTLLGSLTSCIHNKTLTRPKEFHASYYKHRKNQVNKRIKIIYVLTKNEDTIEFNEKYPGRIIETGVYGYPQVNVLYNNVDSTYFSLKGIESIWSHGVQYAYISQDSIGYICHTMDNVNIPLEEIKVIKLKKELVWVPIVILLGGTGVLGCILFVIAIFHALASITLSI